MATWRSKELKIGKRCLAEGLWDFFLGAIYAGMRRGVDHALKTALTRRTAAGARLGNGNSRQDWKHDQISDNCNHFKKKYIFVTKENVTFNNIT